MTKIVYDNYTISDKGIITNVNTGKFIKTWKSAQEAARNGFTQSSIAQVCNGKRNKHKGFKWKWY